jgi:hypothetical protein
MESPGNGEKLDYRRPDHPKYFKEFTLTDSGKEPPHPIFSLPEIDALLEGEKVV